PRPDEAFQVVRLVVVGARSAPDDQIEHGEAYGRRLVQRGFVDQRARGRPSAGAATSDGDPFRVGGSGLDQPPGGGSTVFDVHNAPVTTQPLPILPAVAGGAAVLHVEHTDSPAGEVGVVE